LEFFYLPVLKNLPNGADPKRYSITIGAKADCPLLASKGRQKSAVAPGHSITFSPKHHEAIRVVARPRS
jgi:hypothetical protein